MKKQSLSYFTLFVHENPSHNSSWVPYDESKELAETDNESVRLRFKLIQSRVLDKKCNLENVAAQISDFFRRRYVKAFSSRTGYSYYPITYPRWQPNL
jgi:amidase